MVAKAQQNLETVIFDYLGALREGDQGAVRAVLDPNVTWQSTAPGSFGHPTSAWMMAREVVQDGGGD